MYPQRMKNWVILVTTLAPRYENRGITRKFSSPLMTIAENA